MGAHLDIPEPNDVRGAVARLAGIVNQTPVITSRTLNQRCDASVFIKCENFQRVGAFKFRGAYNAISQLSEAQKRAGVVTHSSGNHAQGVALAAKLLGVPAFIVMPHDAPPIKRQATAGYGATIIPCEAVQRETVSQQLVQDKGYTLIHPYDNAHVMAGQGTAAWELLEEVGELDTLFTPVGGGGLLSGTALAVASQCPTCRVIGVEPTIANDATQSFQTGVVHTLEKVPATIADGLRTRFIGQRNLAVMQRYVTDILNVSEEEILQTLWFVWQRLKVVIEPSAAVALAPLWRGQFAGHGQRIGVIFSGGNVDLLSLLTLFQSVS